jgi:hypothetical protein
VFTSQPSLELYQLHALLLGVNPSIWRRLLVRSDTTIADLHYLLQLAFRWDDFYLHHFLIRGQEYGINRPGCPAFVTDPYQVRLADFRFRAKERFLYTYNYFAPWQVQIRVEAKLPLAPKSRAPICIEGARAAPPEDCGGPADYLQMLDQHHWHPPYDEMLLIVDTMQQIVDANEDQLIRDLIEDLDEFAAAVNRLQAYRAFQPDHFDRRALNRRLQLYREGKHEALWEEE